MKTDDNSRQLDNSVLSKYQKTEKKLLKSINKEAKTITCKLGLQDKVE